MQDQDQHQEDSPVVALQQATPAEPVTPAPFWIRLRRKISNYWAFIIIALMLGLGGGYVLGDSDFAARNGNLAEENVSSPQDVSISAQLIEQINPPDGFSIKVMYGDLGPQLLAAGAVDYDAYVEVYENAGQPLSDEQFAILTEGSDAEIVFDRDNAYFLLNFFWALGLANENPILTDGPMVEYSEGQIERFASTGGWSIAAKPINELYASAKILPLSVEQQKRVDEVAQGVYRPCCNNPTNFPDCNHGMAMLGMLELLAFNGASEDEMFEAAKYANAYWFPQQTLEIALLHKSTQGLNFSELNSREVVGPNFSSGSGFQAVHQWLTENGVLAGSSGGGNSCGV
jgi:hypothetical protein